MVKRVTVTMPSRQDLAARRTPAPVASKISHGMGGVYEAHVRAQVRGRFMEVDLLVENGYTLLEAVRRIGLPRDSWEVLAGGRQQVPLVVFWQKRGSDYRGDPHRKSYAHMSQDTRTTLCGHQLPGVQSHAVTWDTPAGRTPCKACYEALRAMGGGRHG